MVKIVNGHIVSEGEAPKSPFVHLRTDRPRRSSIADLQIAEQQREKLEKLAQEAQSTQAAVVTEQPPPTLKEVINEKFSVFGVMLAVKHLVLLALGSIVIYGVQGLLICLLLVYLGTHINKIQESSMSTTPEIKEYNPNKIEDNASSNKTTSSTSSPIVVKRRFSTLSDLSVPTSA